MSRSYILHLLELYCGHVEAAAEREDADEGVVRVLVGGDEVLLRRALHLLEQRQGPVPSPPLVRFNSVFDSILMFDLIRYSIPFGIRFDSIRFDSVSLRIRFGSVPFDSVRWFDSVRFDSIRFGSVWFRSAPFRSFRWFGSVRFGSVFGGSIRFGSIRFGSVRYGSTWFSSLGSVRSVQSYSVQLFWVLFGSVRFCLFRFGCASRNLLRKPCMSWQGG